MKAATHLNQRGVTTLCIIGNRGVCVCYRHSNIVHICKICSSCHFYGLLMTATKQVSVVRCVVFISNEPEYYRHRVK